MSSKRWTLRTLVLILFFASGSSGLMYQVVWLRMLARTFGVTIHATATVVAAFMAGLALGSYLLGRIVDRRTDPLRVYARLEIAIGLVAALVPLLLAAGLPIYRAVYEATGGSGALTAMVRVVVSFGVLLIPTTLMGGTLPVLTAFLARRDALFGRSFGLLYGLNTAGAVAGVLISGFVTLGAFGERATIAIGVAINLLVGALALLLARSEGSELTVAPKAAAGATPAPTISPYSPWVRRAVLLGFCLSGFTAIAYEIVWTRQLILFLQTSVYAFAGMLAVFLTGISLGSLWISRWVDRFRSPLATFAALELAVCLLTVLNLHLFGPLDSNIAHRVFGLANVVYATILLVLPLTLVFGMIAPVAAVCYARSTDSTGGAIGRLYSANTIGSILGSLVAGFVLVPSLGATRTVVVLAAINLVIAVWFLLLDQRAPVRRRVVGLAGAAVALVLLVGASRTDPFRVAIESRISRRMGTTWIPDSLAKLPPTQKIYLHEEGVEATLTAFEINRFKQLWLNGVGMTFHTTATKLIAHLPMLLVDEPKEFLAIAFGMGTTIRSASRYPELTITGVDLVPETFETFKYYHADAAEVMATGRVHLVANDGRNHLLLSPKLYDIITVDPAPPIYSAGTVNLYSREFFELSKSRLTPGGAFVLWFPGGTEMEVQSVIQTFAQVFPNGSVWSGPHGWGWYFAGTLKPLDRAKMKERLARLYSDSTLVKDLVEWDKVVARPEAIEKMFMWTGAEALAESKQYHIVSDDYPFTEFPLWRYLRSGTQLWHPRSTWLTKPARGRANDEVTPFRDAPAAADPPRADKVSP